MLQFVRGNRDDALDPESLQHLRVEIPDRTGGGHETEPPVQSNRQIPGHVEVDDHVTAIEPLDECLETGGASDPFVNQRLDLWCGASHVEAEMIRASTAERFRGGKCRDGERERKTDVPKRGAAELHGTLP